MKGKLKALLLLGLCGLLFGISPGTRLYSADDDHEHSDHHHHDHIKSASVQFILVRIELEAIREHMEGSDVPVLDSISLEAIGECIQEEDGAEIISQTKLSVLSGHESEMTTIENERRNEKNALDDVNEQAQREVEMFVWIETEILDEDTLAARFEYKRVVVEEGSHTIEQLEEEEGVEQKFEIGSGIVLRDGKACIVGGHLAGEMATLLIMKADLK